MNGILFGVRHGRDRKKNGGRNLRKIIDEVPCYCSILEVVHGHKYGCPVPKLEKALRLKEKR